MSSESWLAELRATARGAAQRGTQVLHGARPPLGDAGSAGALSSLVLAAFVVGAALFRARVTPLPLDLIASGLRTLALAFGARALLGMARFARQLRVDADAARAALVLSEQGLLLQTGRRESWARRDEILGVTVQETLASRSLTPRAPPLLVVLTPAAGRPRYLSIPPFFAPNTEILRARLARWLAPTWRPPTAGAVPPDPEQRYAQAARGQLEDGMVVVPEGRGYLLRAPYAALLGLVFALDVLRTAGAARDQIAGPVLATCLLTAAVLASWFVWLRRRGATRLGIGLVLTPEELLVRDAAGVVSVPWPQLSELIVQTSARWSPFVGTYPARALELSTQEGQRMVIDEGFLGVPAEVVALLCRAYRGAEGAQAPE